MQETFETRIKKLQNLIDNAKRTVFFGGAGVSTESGIPDFRSKDGLYNQRDIRFEKYEPEYLLSESCLHNEPEVFFEFYRQKMDCRNVQPNMAHKKLAELELNGKLYAIITQNIDNLHQKAGSKNVLEIHGTTNHVYCEDCGKTYNPNILFDLQNGKIAKCTCGGLIRPDVTLYGEMLPQKAWNEAVKSLHSADLLIIGGTSLMVYPANTLAKDFYGDNIVIINREKTQYDSYASLVFRESIGEVFSHIKA